ncbi:MAG: hypothetical protein E7Z63_06740 [Thermoplasmata archaeon]|nr:hypothetical protein [Thermoplasmata archaeon]
MNSKILAVAVVAVIAAAGAGAALFLMNNDDKKEDDSILTHRLLTMGNVYSDDTLDSKDVKVLEAVIAGDKEVTVAGNKIDLTDSALLRYSDVNQDGNVNDSDVETLNQIIAGNASKLFYENAKGNITSVQVPINNLVVMFRRVGTTVAMVGATDMVKGFISDMAAGGNYGFLGFTGTNVGSASEPDIEAIKSLDTEYSSTGGVTLIADATGAAANLEEKVGTGIDVVRMPVTEMGKSENGVVTLGYLLAYKNDKHDQIMNKLDQWIEWNDSAKKKIEEAVAKLKDEDKKTCLIGMWASAGGGLYTLNVRGAGVSEYEYTVYCGGKNVETGSGGSKSIAEINEYLVTYNPEYTFVMQQEVQLLKNKIPAQTTLDEVNDAFTDNYHGKIGVFSQFFGTGPGYVLSLMYYASVLVPDLADTFDITKEYKFFMKDLVGNAELAEVQAFIPIAA